MARRVLALLVVLCIGAAACGGDDSESSGGGESAGNEQQGAADPDGVVHLAFPLVSPTTGSLQWDPTRSNNALSDLPLFQWVYGGLLRPDTDGSLVPDLAESATVADPNTIEVVMRPEVTFPDGSPVDANAVKAVLEANLARPSVPAFDSDFYKLSAVEVVDPATLRLTIPDGTAPSWYDTILGGMPAVIVPPGTDFTRPSGAGPFRVVEFEPEARVVLEKNPDYWDADTIEVARIELLNAPDPQASASALNAGQVDWARLDTATMDAVGSAFEVEATPDANSLTSFAICKTSEPFSDPRVRQALSMAIDRDAISQAVYAGTAVPASGLWPDDHPFHNPDLTDYYEYDPEAAEDLLAEAGYPDGFTFDVIPNPSSGTPEVTQAVQQQFAEIGVTMNIVQTSNFVQDFYINAKAPMGVTPSTSTAGRRRLLQWTGTGISNICDYNDPDLSELVGELASVRTDSDEAVDLWHEIEEKVLDDALSIFVTFQSRVTGYDGSRLGDVVNAGYSSTVPEIREVFVKA